MNIFPFLLVKITSSQHDAKRLHNYQLGGSDISPIQIYRLKVESSSFSYLAPEGGLGDLPCSGDGDRTSDGDLRIIGEVAAKENKEKKFVLAN